MGDRPRSLGTMVKKHQEQWNEIMDGKKQRIATEDFAELRQQTQPIATHVYGQGDVPPPPPLDDDEEEAELGKIANTDPNAGALDAPLLQDGKGKKKSMSTVSDYWNNVDGNQRKGCCVVL